MCEQTEIDYLDGDVVWVKLGSCWWPGEVVGPEKLPPDVLPSFRKPPIAVVKFFQENAYEYVKNINSIYKYNCSRKTEFINKGLYMYRTKHGHMEKFPEDVIRAETAVGGDIEILTRDEFQEVKKESYAGIFGDSKKSPGSIKKGRGRGRPASESPKIATPIRKSYKEKTNYKVHILLQGSKETPPQSTGTEGVSTPSTSRAGSEVADEKPQKVDQPAATPSTSSTPVGSSSGSYSCHACSFSTTRLSVLILHNKTHSVTFTPYTPSPVRKKPAAKSSTKTTPKSSKTPKIPRPRKEKTDKIPKTSSQAQKRSAEEKSDKAEVKKQKTDQEIKSSLLADWDDMDEDSNDESSAMVMTGSPEVPAEAESPAEPTPAELPSAQVPGQLSSPVEKKSEESSSAEKPESSSDSKYEFCEDEDWPLEADGGRKIPRVKNPSKRKEETKSLSIDEDEVAKEVAELLNKTTVPELPSVPEPLKIEENFPEPSIIKSPDKTKENSSENIKPSETTTPESKPTKAIFKTKTFFRSRHSRSQDAIGKYVAEQLNAAERMDLSEGEINGSDVVSSPEARESPPVEHIKVARLAPKIQLKKMKAEAAQLREKDKSNISNFAEDTIASSTKFDNFNVGNKLDKDEENIDHPVSSKSLQDVLYPTQEIKPINKDLPKKLAYKEDNKKEYFGKVQRTIQNTAEKDECGIDKGLSLIQETLNTKKSLVLKRSEQSKKIVEHFNEIATPEGICEKSPPKSSENLKISIFNEDSKLSPQSHDQKRDIIATPNEKLVETSFAKEDQLSEIPSSEMLCEKSPQKVDQASVITSTTRKINERSPSFAKEDQLSEIPSPEMLSEKSPQKLYDQLSAKINERTPGLKKEDQLSEIPSSTDEMLCEKSPQKVNDQPSAISSPTKRIDERSPQKSHDHFKETSSPVNITHESPQISCNEQNVALSPIQTIQDRSPQKSHVQLNEILSSRDISLQTLHDPGQSGVLSTPIDEMNETSVQTSHDEPKEVLSSVVITSEQNLQKSYEQMIQPYMNESTASAVDALLSVSRETDRVPRIISNDLPEDLFEDDVVIATDKDDSIQNNGIIVDNINKDHGICEDRDMEYQKPLLEEMVPDVNEKTIQEVSHEVVRENIVSEDSSLVIPKEDDSIVQDTITETVTENIPTESDLQIAEALINLPSTAIQNKTSKEHQDGHFVPMCIDSEPFEEEIIPASETIIENDNKIYEANENEAVSAELPSESLLISNNKKLNIRYETEQEKSENLNAAQSLVQMSESIDHKLNIVENNAVNNKEVSEGVLNTIPSNGKSNSNTVEQKLALLSSENSSDPTNGRSPKFETTSSKLLKILEEPCTIKSPVNKTTPIKQLIVPGTEKILNFDVAKSSLKGKTHPPKQKIIIRRSASSKSFINNLTDVVTSPDKIIISRSNPTVQDGSVQTFTIQSPQETHSKSDPNPILIPQKVRKITKPTTKLQKIKPLNSLITQRVENKTLNETKTTEEPIFDINSMPVVLSDDILTPESIEKMPIVMSDGNIISNPPKLMKTKPTIIESEKVQVSATPSKPEVKTLLMNTANDANKVSTTPNILSKSSKLRGAKPMLVIDKATGKQKIIMTKAEPAIKEIKQPPTLIQQVPQTVAKTEKFIILPTTSSPRAGRTQKIVIDPATGKAHVLVAKGQETSLNVPETKPVSAKLIPSTSDTSTPGNTVMIITNAQGAQSRIVLTPEHEKILFPNKQQPNVSQLKTITHRLSTNPGIAQKTIVTTAAPVKTHTKIVPKQKSAIITSKGQLIVGGRMTTTAHNIAPMPEIRPAPKRILAEPKKLVQTIQKTTSEPLIFLQQKSGFMQLTAAQFEHLQRTGQLVQKAPAPVPENKIVVQKSITITPKEPMVPTIQKQRVRKTATESLTHAKKIKQEIAIAPAPALSAPLPPLTSLSSTVVSTPRVSISSIVPTVSNTVSVATTAAYPDLENFEELLPSTSIARHSEPPAPPPPEPVVEQTVVAQPEAAPPAQLSDGQLLAVPGENFGGPAGSFYLCVEDNGTLTPIDNRPLVLENNQLVPMAMEPVPVFTPQPERRDILEAALANSDVFQPEPPREEAPDFRDLNANVSVHCRVSETSTTLNQPIMTPIEVPSKRDAEPAIPSNLEDGLAVIGVTPHTVPTSLELPITVTDPRIAPKTTDPLSNSNYRTSLLPSPSTEMTYMTTEEVPMVGPISMPLLTDEESVGKSMPILTDEVTERTVSSVESTLSPSSVEVRESEAEEGGQWSRRLLTPGSDTSETSAEIPLQPVLQLSVSDMSRHS